jgi:hypothetical protein
MLGWLVAIVVLVLVLFSRRDGSEGFVTCAANQYAVSCANKKDIGADCNTNDECTMNFCKPNKKCGKKPNNTACSAASECESDVCSGGFCGNPVATVINSSSASEANSKCRFGKSQKVPNKNQYWCGCEGNDHALDPNNIGRGCKLIPGKGCNNNSDCMFNMCDTFPDGRKRCRG